MVGLALCYGTTGRRDEATQRRRVSRCSAAMGAAALLLVCAFSATQAVAHEIGSDPDAAWFQGLHRPDGVNCCNMEDCHRTEAWKVVGGHYAVLIDGQTIEVADDKVLRVPNPTGFAVECHIPGHTAAVPPFVLCFIPAVGV